MGDYRRARAHMVESQVYTSSVSDRRILTQMGTVPRERFVSPARREVAYVDDIQWLGTGSAARFMAPPALVAKLLQLCRIEAGDDVLVVGCGTGYTVALIAGMAASVTGVESDSALVEVARAELADLGNASVIEADLLVPPAGPFDVILVEGALDAVPDTIVGALREGGRLVVPLMRSGVPVAHLIERSGATTTTRAEFKAALPPLMPVRAGETFVF